jgi:hypothetical protein
LVVDVLDFEDFPISGECHCRNEGGGEGQSLGKGEYNREDRIDEDCVLSGVEESTPEKRIFLTPIECQNTEI